MRYYKVTMRQGNDSINCFTTVLARTPEAAADEVKQMWSGITVKVLEVTEAAKRY